MTIYLDHNATTPPVPEVIEAMLPFWREQWGNPSSLHHFGRAVAPALDRAREQAAALIGAERTAEIVFTSGGTEGNNTAIRGALAARSARRHIVTTAVEHSSVRQCCRALEKEGYRVTYLAVNRQGQLDLAQLEATLSDDTALASIMWANNESGTIFPIERIAQICRARGVPLHTDAVQVVGKCPMDLRTVLADLVSVSGHKFHAPKGVGFLYIRRGTPFRPLIVGGGQEYGRRAGTENVAGIVGLGVACTLAAEAVREPAPAIERLRDLRDRLERGVQERLPGVHVNGDVTARVPNTCNVSIEDVDGETLIIALSAEGIAASTGSACSQGSTEPSHVLTAMHLPPPLLRGTLRLSLGRHTTAAEIDQALDIIPKVVTRLRQLHPKGW